MKLAIIIPNYNNEHLVGNLLNSMGGLDMNKIETILVNDNPQKDLKNLEKKYKKYNLKVINNKKNMWVHISRYIGAKNISNDVTHLMFADPDDRFENIDWFDVVVKNQNKIIQFDHWRQFKNKLVKREYGGSMGNWAWGRVYPIKMYFKHKDIWSNKKLHDDGFTILSALKDDFDNGKFLISKKTNLIYYMYSNGYSKEISGEAILRELESIKLSNKKGYISNSYASKKMQDLLWTKGKNNLPKETFNNWLCFSINLWKRKKIYRFIGFFFRNASPYFWFKIWNFIRREPRIKKPIK